MLNIFNCALHFVQREDSCVKKDELENLRELLLDIAEILNRRAGILVDLLFDRFSR